MRKLAAGLQHLGQLTGLQSLTLGCQESIADSGLHNLSSLTNLTELIFHSSGTEPEVGDCFTGSPTR